MEAHEPKSPVLPGAFRTPLTDPRSLLSSVSFHAVLLLLGSLIALRATRREEPRGPASIRAELGPVDNLAPPPGGGGGPGERGGTGPAEARVVAFEPGERPTAAGKDEALLQSLLPSPTTSSASENPRELRGFAGAGVVPGPGLGGGGGEGGGSGGGRGAGLGPSTVFFGTAEQASSFAYAIDRSGSMSGRNALNLAKRELLASLAQLPPDAQFSVIFYNLEPTQIAGFPRPGGLVSMTQGAREQVRARMAAIDAEGGTDHARALRAAFAAGPEVVFLLTDGFHMTRELAEQLRQEAGPIRIHVIEFGQGAEPDQSDPVQDLARGTGGSYRYVDVGRFAASAGVR